MQWSDSPHVRTPPDLPRRERPRTHPPRPGRGRRPGPLGTPRHRPPAGRGAGPPPGARALGSRGDYERAFELFDQAQALAPDWPYPSYDKAYSYLLQGDPARAEALYAEVDRM